MLMSQFSPVGFTARIPDDKNGVGGKKEEKQKQKPHPLSKNKKHLRVK